MRDFGKDLAWGYCGVLALQNSMPLILSSCVGLSKTESVPGHLSARYPGSNSFQNSIDSAKSAISCLRYSFSQSTKSSTSSTPLDLDHAYTGSCIK